MLSKKETIEEIELLSFLYRGVEVVGLRHVRVGLFLFGVVAM